MKKILDEAMDQIEKDRQFAKTHLDRQAIYVRAIDKQITALEEKIKILEAQKQKELTKMEEFLELGVVLSHTLPDGYTVTYDHKRKIEVKDVSEFLRWLKAHCKPHEVLTFFEGAIKLTNLKKFVEKKCDEMRANGVMDPKVDGVEIGEITFRRLTTFYKEKEDGK